MAFEVAFQHNSTLAKNEPSWGSVNKSKLPDAAFARKGSKSERGFPHHWVQGGKGSNADGEFTSGTMYLHKGGLHAAWAAANGARSGDQAGPAVKAHLRRHMAAIGETKKQTAAIAEITIEAVDALDKELITAGLLTPKDLEYDPAALLSKHVCVDCGC